MSNPIQEAVQRTGWSECVIAYLYEEFTEEFADEVDADFFEYLADQVGTAAFVIAACGGFPVEGCLEAYAQGGSSVLDEDFDVSDAIESINLAEIPDDDTGIYDEK